MAHYPSQLLTVATGEETLMQSDSGDVGLAAHIELISEYPKPLEANVVSHV